MGGLTYLRFLRIYDEKRHLTLNTVHDSFLARRNRTNGRRSVALCDNRVGPPISVQQFSAAGNLCLLVCPEPRGRANLPNPPPGRRYHTTNTKA